MRSADDLLAQTQSDLEQQSEELELTGVDRRHFLFSPSSPPPPSTSPAL